MWLVVGLSACAAVLLCPEIQQGSVSFTEHTLEKPPFRVEARTALGIDNTIQIKTNRGKAFALHDISYAASIPSIVDLDSGEHVTIFLGRRSLGGSVHVIQVQANGRIFIDAKLRNQLYSEKKVYAILAVIGYACICLAVRSRNYTGIGSSVLPVIVLTIALYRLFR